MSDYAYEQKRFSAMVLSTDEKGTFTGDGAVFDELHPTSSFMLPSDWKDTLRHGAFKETLAERMPALVYQHDISRPIGVYSEVRESEKTLKVKGQLAVNATDGRDAYELMKLGALDGLSIGFKPVKVALDEKKKVREILSVKLFEISPVTIPAIDNARVLSVKSQSQHRQSVQYEDPRNKRFLEQLLRDAGLSREEAKGFIARGYSALRDAEPSPTEEPALRDAAADLIHLVRGLRIGESNGSYRSSGSLAARGDGSD